MHARPFAIIALLAASTFALGALAACTINVTQAPSTLTAATPIATSTPPASAATTAPVATLSHADPELESLLPTTLQGVSLVRASQRGADLTRDSSALDAMLEHLGKTIEDFTLASAYSEGGQVKGQIGAWRISGAETARLVPEFITAVQASSTTTLDTSEITLGGRTVTQIGGPGQLTQGPLYVYAKNDVILFVQTPDPAIAREALERMP